MNAAECEPLIETDKYLCRTYADRIVVAATAIATHLGAAHTVIALKRKYEPEIAALQAAIDKAGAAIKLFPMETFYPAGDEQTMVQLVTGKTVPERGLPIDVGAVVDNVGTLLNIYGALTEGAGVSSKFLSVTGEVREPIMLHVPIGTAITEDQRLCCDFGRTDDGQSCCRPGRNQVGGCHQDNRQPACPAT